MLLAFHSVQLDQRVVTVLKSFVNWLRNSFVVNFKNVSFITNCEAIKCKVRCHFFLQGMYIALFFYIGICNTVSAYEL